jgi:phosphomannomutase
VFGFEEALGYLVNPRTLRDKDGISAGVAFLSLAARAAAEGRTVADRLDEFVERFGCFASSQVSIRVTDLSRIADVMARLRAEPPTEVGGIRVERIDDLARGIDGLPPSDVLRIRLEGGARVMVRPSGTEPKLKVYIDAAATEGSVAERRAAASDVVERLEAGMRELVA